MRQTWRNVRRSFKVFVELPILGSLPIGSPIEKLPQLFLGNPFERTRHG